MDELLNSLLTWSDVKLVPVSSLPSIVESTASLQDRDECAIRPKDSFLGTNPPAREHGILSQAISFKTPQVGKEQNIQRRSIIDERRGGDEVLNTPSAKTNVAQASPGNRYSDPPPGRESSTNAAQTFHLLQRSTESSFNQHPQTFRGVLSDSAHGIAPQKAEKSLAQMDALPPPHVDGLDMMSIDDFEKMQPFTPPPAKMINLSSPPGDGIYANTFHMKCQAKGLTPYFTYIEPSKGCFLATAHVDNQPLEQVGPYASKKAAKEAACEASIAKLDAFPDKAELKRAEVQKALPVIRTLEHNTGECVSNMNAICQQKRLVPNITFAEPKKGCFSAAFKMDDKLIGEVGLFANKRDAKEELCRVLYPKLLEYDNRKKRKSTDPSDEPHEPSEILKEENWIGTLAEHCQHSKITYPVYNETGPHPSQGPFSCAVHFAGSPPSGFGSAAGPFKKKADAKKNAAMEAVLWLRHQAQLVDVVSSKLRDSSTTSTGDPTPATPTTDLSQSFADDMNVDQESLTPNRSIGRQVQDLCLRLGFANPAFELVPLSDSFYNVHAVFTPQDTRYEQRLSGAVAPVYNVRGKKTAKDQCWAELWKVLEEIRVGRTG